MTQLIAVVLNWNGGDDTLGALASLEGIQTICVEDLARKQPCIRPRRRRTIERGGQSRLRHCVVVQQ